MWRVSSSAGADRVQIRFVQVSSFVGTGVVMRGGMGCACVLVRLCAGRGRAAGSFSGSVAAAAKTMNATDALWMEDGGR